VEKGLLSGSAEILHNTEKLKVTAKGEKFLGMKSKHLARIEKTWRREELALRMEPEKDFPLSNASTNVTISMFRSATGIPVPGSCFFNPILLPG